MPVRIVFLPHPAPPLGAVPPNMRSASWVRFGRASPMVGMIFFVENQKIWTLKIGDVEEIIFHFQIFSHLKHRDKHFQTCLNNIFKCIIFIVRIIILRDYDIYIMSWHVFFFLDFLDFCILEIFGFWDFGGFVISFRDLFCVFVVLCVWLFCD